MLSNKRGYFRSKRWVVGFLVGVWFAIGFGTPVMAQSWMQLLFQGLQFLQLANLTDAQEVRLGQQVNQQFLQQGRFRVVGDRRLQAYVNNIGQTLAQYSSRPRLPYTFQVVEDPAVNAFATLGGFVYINTGLMAAADNEAELAGVIAHEIAHISDRHGVSRLRDQTLSQGLITAAGVQESTLVQMALQFGVNLPMSREDELAADRLGLQMLVRAGYAPVGMISFMEKLQQRGYGAPEFLSTHPQTQNRLRALQRSIPGDRLYAGEGLDASAYAQIVSALNPNSRSPRPASKPRHRSTIH